MPQNTLNDLNMKEIFPFIMMLVTGCIGGCAAAFQKSKHDKKKIIFLSFIAYAITGSFGAILLFGISNLFFEKELAGYTFNQLSFWAAIAGFSTASALAGTNLAFHFVLDKLGIQIDIEIKKVDKKK